MMAGQIWTPRRRVVNPGRYLPPDTSAEREVAFRQLMARQRPPVPAVPVEPEVDGVPTNPRAVLSCDLGQGFDHTALAVIEWRADGSVHVADCRIYPTGMDYVAQVAMIQDAIHAVALPNLDLLVVVDRGSAGRAVLDLLRAGLVRPPGVRVSLSGVAITPGTSQSGSPRAREWSISKTRLPDPLQRLLATDKLTFAPDLDPELKTQLLGLEITREDSVRRTISWQGAAGSKDDAALAVAQGLAAGDLCWGPKVRAKQTPPAA